MAKIKAVLDQETWVEVDVPDEFQAIVTSLFSLDPLITGNLVDAESNAATDYGEVVSSNDASSTVDGGLSNHQPHIEQTDSVETSVDVNAQVKSSSSVNATGKSKADVISASAQYNSSNMKEHGKSTSHTLIYGGASYHMVNWLVILSNFFSFFVVVVVVVVVGGGGGGFTSLSLSSLF